MTMKNFVRFSVLMIFSVLALAAQETRGQILGRVTDPQGALVVGATVTALNSATGVTASTLTNGTGDYTLPFLVAGAYDLTVTAPGFKKYERKNIGIRMQDAITLNVQMD